VTHAIAEIAGWIAGEVIGDPTTPIVAARTLTEAGPGEITFVEDDRYLGQLATSRAAAAVVGPDVTAEGMVLVRVADPLMAFVEVVRRLHGSADDLPPGIDSQACIHPSAVLGEGCRVGPGAVIAAGCTLGRNCQVESGVVIGRQCRLGDDVRLYGNVTLYAGTILGQRVIVHGNAVLGGDGFGYRFHNGRHVKVPQLGWVEIGDDVEIGAGTTIDRGTFGPTRIGAGTKIDNLVQIGHNCVVGRHNIIVSQVGMAGSTTTGDYVAIAGQVGITGHLHIGDGATVGGGTAVIRDVPAGQRVLGRPARPEREEKRILLTMDKLPEMVRQVKAIMRRLGLSEAA
jgi:UDP-3-O-[3-hydroxymyristoyl] glucosamine N-acyltransferase